MSQLLFSVVVACYNQEAFIKEAVDSALSQQCQNKEIIVVDDASHDRTADILRTFGESITFARLPLNSGVAAARNHGASLAKGEYLVFLDGDDVLMPQALQTYARLIAARHPKFLFGRSSKCAGQVPPVTTVNPTDKIRFVEYSTFLNKDRPCVFNTSTLVVDRSTFWSVGGWSPGIFYQDIQDLVTKLGVSGTMILVLAPATVWYRMHSTNAVTKIRPFVNGIYVLLARAKAGLYPGGRQCWFDRSVWFGGLGFYWTKTAIRAGLYRDGFILLARCWWMILFAIFRRSMAWLVGRQPIKTLSLSEL